ncbi:MAG TPA: ABC-type transport auxiliary lipoprotein family protein [Caulobacteraceae bacterium]|nr:ABC-type transport auxiliary lipoprotein family protein [Caulobacteraceae bacterium]
MRTARAPSAIVLALALAGCVSLLPKSKPAQLYRFELPPSASVAPAPTATTILLGDIGFTPASEGDQILTVRGDEAAYIAAARWVSPARRLFEAAIRDAFARDGGNVRLLAQGELAPAAFVLKLDVRRFEVDYAGDEPTVRIDVFAALSAARGAPGERTRTFSAAVPASANRVSAIVPAFDAAVAHVAGDLTAWVAAG